MGRDPVTTILEGRLFLGDRHGARDLHYLKNLGVTHVVNAAVEQPNVHPNELTYFNCNLKDNRKAQLDFYAPLLFIQQALEQGGVVFVHCFLGKSRSASMVIGYLMWAYGMSLDDAMEWVCERRPCVKPNPNFRAQLQRLEATLLGMVCLCLRWLCVRDAVELCQLGFRHAGLICWPVFVMRPIP